MAEKTRRSFLVAVGISLASAGCLSDFEAGPGEATTENATRTTEGTATSEEPATVETTTDETAAPGTATEARTKYAADSPEPDHSIYLRSDAGESRTVQVRIVREATGETVFETTAEARVGERTLYNLRQADPEDVEAFRVCAEVIETKSTATETATATPTTESERTDSWRRDCATIRTSECYGSAHITVEADGSPQIIYAIC